MQKVEIKKQYVAPKVAELGNISTITLTPVQGHGSCPYKFPINL